MKEDKKIKRSQYLISAQFQFGYVAQMLIILYIGAAIAGYTVYYTAWVTLGEKLANVYPRGRFVFLFNAANAVLFLRLLLITPLFVIIGILLSHRIAGPIYRIGKYADSLIRGDYEQDITLRKRDEFKPLALKMSDLCKTLRAERENRKKAVEKLVESLGGQKVEPRVLNEIKTSLKDF